MPKFVTIDYTNWRGERGFRYVRPLRMEWGSNEWHRTPQWLLVAHDAERNAERTFAFDNIHSWVQDPEEPDALDMADIPGDLARAPKR
jgi:predicted DNA-binding transcriptional regulator YafY